MHVREGMRQAVEDEIREVRRRLGDLARIQLVLRNGVLLEATPGAFLYRFTCERVEAEPGEESIASFQIPEDTTGVLQSEGRYVPAAVLGHDPLGREITLELQLVTPLRRTEGELTFSTLFLLAGLRDRLIELGVNPLPPVEAALDGRGDAVPDAPSASLLTGVGIDQAAAIKSSLSRTVSFVWGPPGTGKTRTLAQLTTQLLEANESVLLTANTNVAVDRLVGATLDALGSPARPPVLRLGRSGASLRGRGVSAEELLEGSPEFTAWSTRLAALLRGAGVSIPDEWSLETVLRLAGWAMTAHEILTGQLSPQTVLELLELAGRILAALAGVEAPIMAATLCGTYTRTELRARRFDTVIVDEASMASVAHFTAAAGLAKRRVVIAGDFQQLPPIVLADTPEARRYLGQHMFAFIGCDEVSRDHSLRSMLREQWRMHPEIGRAVSRVFYGGRLVDAPAISDRASSGRGGMLLVDTHGCTPRSHRTPSRSIRNAVHARLIAEWLPGSGWKTIGVIAPYRAQARLLRRALRATCRSRLEDGSLQVSTVHKFQGEERDLIVFDTTDAPEMAGHFLNDVRNPAAANLVNVAISRAKHALLIVGDVPHLRMHLGTGSSVFKVVMEAMGAREEVDAADAADVERLLGFLLQGR